MRGPSAVEDDAFLAAEARELSLLAKERADPAADRRRPASILHTLDVELSVLIGLGDRTRMDWLVGETTRLLTDEHRPDALAALQSALSRRRQAPMPASENVARAEGDAAFLRRHR